MHAFKAVHAALILFLIGCVTAGCGRSEANAEAPAAEGNPSAEVNVYSARHYDSDDALFAEFTDQTGIAVNVIEANADELIARIEREGELSPADVFIAVDAARLFRAEQKGLFQPTSSPVLTERIPATRRHPDGLWFGLTERARVIVAHKDRVPSSLELSYEDLATPEWTGRVLIRSSSNVYNQSLVASMISSIGPEATEAWCEGITGNLARTPQGGDRDQIRAVAAGEGDVAIVNHYYLARMLDGSNATDRAVAESVRVIFPNQDGRGTHVNVCGAGVVTHAPNRENAVRFLEYLATADAQRAIAAGNYEYPVVADAAPVAVVQGFGEFEADDVVVSEYGSNNAEAVMIMDRVGWR
ncbi:MAG: Fe(3+) ABC transporter substrate-binding protein [Planctomycetota bacterium]